MRVNCPSHSYEQNPFEDKHHRNSCCPPITGIDAAARAASRDLNSRQTNMTQKCSEHPPRESSGREGVPFSSQRAKQAAGMTVHLRFGPFLPLLLHPGLPLPPDDVPGVLLGLPPDGRNDPADVLAPGQTLDPRGGELSPLFDHIGLFQGYTNIDQGGVVYGGCACVRVEVKRNRITRTSFLVKREKLLAARCSSVLQKTSDQKARPAMLGRRLAPLMVSIQCRVPNPHNLNRGTETLHGTPRFNASRG